MQATILLFGHLKEIAGAGSIAVENVADTGQLATMLHEMFPELKKASYLVAVDKKIVHENTPLQPGAVVALLPPFSGG